MRSTKIYTPILFLSLFFTLLFFPGGSGRASALTPDEERVANLIEGAKDEGKLVLYTSLNVTTATPMLDAFRAKYPFIKTELFKTKSIKILSKYLAEVNAKKYMADTFALTSIVLDVLKKKGLLMKYITPESKIFPEGLTDSEGFWNALFLQLRVVTYNTKLVRKEDVPRSYEDMLDPKWKGKMGMDYREYVWFAAQLKLMGKEKGIAFMRKLAKQDLSFRGSKSLLIQLCAAGEMSLVVTAFLHRVETYKKEGAPVDWISISPIVTGLSLAGIAKHSPHPNSAKLFIDYILSAEGQKAMANLGQTVSRPDVNSTPPIKVLRKMKLYPAHPRNFDNYDETVKLYDSIFH
ncbi:ABC transporter substrate-binding protein [Thermodesulfobacteriota bacterium]